MSRTVFLALALVALGTPAAVGPEARGAVPNGLSDCASSPLCRVSPLGSSRIDLVATGGQNGVFEFTLEVTEQDGTRSTIPRVRASEVLATDAGRIVVVESPDTHALPATIRILRLDGSELLSREVSGLTNPTVSPDGFSLRYESRGSARLLDLRTLEDLACSPESLPDPAVPRRAAPIPREEAAPPAAARRDAGIPWPLLPDAQHPVGNTYGEFQNYGGASYLHPGIDVMGSPSQPVYAVRRGVIKAILTTSGFWHWRVAVGDTATAGTCKGYLYAHLNESTIAVGVGDPVTEGQYLGDLVEWPVYGFHHCHFARIEDSGTVWDGSWLTAENPHLDITNQSDDEPPAFEPASGSDLLAFAENQTAVYQDPGALHGAVDIIAHVGDTIESPWVCTVQEIRYTIYPLGYPNSPVVDDRLSVDFDMVLDTYSGGPIDPFLVGLLYKDDATCPTQGDYDYREFYHIVTNSDGDGVYEQSDLWEAWDTAALPDADYVVRVLAVDAAGNAAADSMVVSTANGNPSSVPPGAGALSIASLRPNPTHDRASVELVLPRAEDVTLSVLDLAGRLVARLHEGRAPAGVQTFVWDGRDDTGSPVASGVYFVMAEAGGRVRAEKVVLLR